MIVRKENLGDASAIRALITAAFDQPKLGQLADRLRADGAAEFSLVAVEGGKLLGHVMCSRLHAELRALGLAPLSVHPEHQRRGIGSLLVAEGLEHAARAGWEIVFVLGDPGFYTRFGFDPVLAGGFLSAYSGPNFMARLLGKSVSRRGGKVDYPHAFAELGA